MEANCAISAFIVGSGSHFEQRNQVTVALFNGGRCAVTDQPIGKPVPGFVPPRMPDAPHLLGRYARLELLDPAGHAADLFAANAGADSNWTYLPYGPFATLQDYRVWLDAVAAQADPVFYAIKDIATDRWSGVASFLRITPQMGSIEVGHINFAPPLQGRRAATEAMALMMGWAFDAGYRRYEWKCDALNLPSRRAAQRLGLSYEGVFRQAAIVKGRNRDTAWFAATDGDWPVLRAAYDRWLAPVNFDAQGVQKQRLSDLTASVLVARDLAL